MIALAQRKTFFSVPCNTPRAVSYLLLGLDILGIAWISIFLFFILHPISFLPYLFSWHFIWRLSVFLIFLFIFDLYKFDTYANVLRSPGRSLVAIILAGVALLFISRLLDPLEGKEIVGGNRIHVFTVFIFAVWAAGSRVVVFEKLKPKESDLYWLVLTDEDFLRKYEERLTVFFNMSCFKFLLKDEKKSTKDKFSSLKNIGTWKDLEKDLKQYNRVVVMVSRPLSQDFLQKLLSYKFQGIEVLDLTEFYEKYFLKFPVFHLTSENILHSLGLELLPTTVGLKLKNIFDFTLSFVIFLISLPLFLLIMIVIRLETKGPVFFKQERVGVNEKSFTIYKFRTMYSGSEKGSHYTKTNDKRVTKVGKVLRKLRLDELPQLINVLKGDMSLIGPRAEWTELVAEYEKHIPYYHFRHVIKPGITGWAQVLYPYGASIDDAREKLQYDLYYIKNYNFLLDISIVIKTCRVMLFGQGV